MWQKATTRSEYEGHPTNHHERSSCGIVTDIHMIFNWLIDR